MEVQRIRLPGTDRLMWLVLDGTHLPVEPVQHYLRYLDQRDRSPNTIRAYAYHLRLFWAYLHDRGLDWTGIGLDELTDFVVWLRQPRPADAAAEARGVATINAILAAVVALYDYHQRRGVVREIPLYRQHYQPGRPYKPFLHHIARSKPAKVSLLRLKAPQRHPRTLTAEQIRQLLAACRRERDRFLVRLLAETGMRVGQALGLRHEDVVSWDNQVRIVPRDNANGARAKARDPYLVDVSPELMVCYTRYLVDEFGDRDSDYVFLNLWDGAIGAPLTYPTVHALFVRLSAAAGVRARPHMLRHTHATDLIRSGWDAALVRRRLGHSDIQTTVNTYVHLTGADMKAAYQGYLADKARARR